MRSKTCSPQPLTDLAHLGSVRSQWDPLCKVPDNCLRLNRRPPGDRPDLFLKKLYQGAVKSSDAVAITCKALSYDAVMQRLHGAREPERNWT